MLYFGSINDKESIFNSAMNRFQLNFLKNVGAHPSRFENVHQKNLEEWREYYFDNLGSKEYIIELGKKLLFR